MVMQFNMPDLSSLQARSAQFAQNRYFQNLGPQDPAAYALVLSFIRLSD